MSDAHRHDAARDQHGNPKDLKAYLERLLSPDRDEWQKPDEVLEALKIKGRMVAEIGAGPGYFTLRLAEAVGPKGSVLAVEVEPKLLGILRDRLDENEVGNVTPILALAEDPFLPRASCDVILAVNSFHHFHELPAYLRRLKSALKRHGRIVNVDFHDRETPVGPPVDHRLSRSAFLAAARKAGLHLAREHDFLPYQYFLELTVR
ncbi:MAG TPA: class I SAM-dependent methyltransferase [Myxococcales bacterium]|jgi:ubiquinone/menaquinone biosynthesis C-methylase UbiE